MLANTSEFKGTANTYFGCVKSRHIYLGLTLLSFEMFSISVTSSHSFRSFLVNGRSGFFLFTQAFSVCNSPNVWLASPDVSFVRVSGLSCLICALGLKCRASPLICSFSKAKVITCSTLARNKRSVLGVRSVYSDASCLQICCSVLREATRWPSLHFCSFNL